MWKKQALIIQKDYPFGTINSSQSNKYCVKKKLARGEGHLEKTKILSSLKNENLIKIQGVEEQNGEYYLVYEYVSQSIEKWYVQVNRQYIQNYEQRLILFSRYLTDKGIITAFRRENMGVTDIGEPKYYLDTTFTYNLAIDKLAQKKKYKEDIRQLIQYYLDKNKASKLNTIKKAVPEKKENNKILKILQAIEKGKANLCSQNSKEHPALLHNKIAQLKVPSHQITNFHNVFIQKQVNHINKIQVIIGNNKPVELIQQNFKRQYASSSFYLNGIQTAKFQKQSQARRLLSPSDKYNKFQEVNYKEYKNIKASGEKYVQDFINVLEAQQIDKNVLLCQPRLTMHISPHSNIHVASKRITEQKEKQMIKNATIYEQNQQIKAVEQKGRAQKKLSIKDSQEIKVVKIDEKQHQKRTKVNDELKIQSQMMAPASSNKQASDIQKKVNQAIVNSLNAINRIKNGKANQICT